MSPSIPVIEIVDDSGEHLGLSQALQGSSTSSFAPLWSDEQIAKSRARIRHLEDYLAHFFGVLQEEREALELQERFRSHIDRSTQISNVPVEAPGPSTRPPERIHVRLHRSAQEKADSVQNPQLQ